MLDLIHDRYGSNKENKGNINKLQTVNTTTLYSITYGNNMYIIVGDRGTILTSTDGITWTKHPIITEY